MLGNLPVSSIKKYIDSKIPDGWSGLENETVFLELGVQYSERLNEVLNLLRVLKEVPDLFYEDPLFFLYASEVFNGNVADFSNVPHINSLEAAFAIVDCAKAQGKVAEESEPFAVGVREIVKHILVNDGYSQAVWPFTCVGVTSLVGPDMVTLGTKEDMAKKERAIKEYINGTYSQ